MWALLHATGAALAGWSSTYLPSPPVLTAAIAIIITLIVALIYINLKRSVKLERLKNNISRLMSNTWTGSISSFDITVPETVTISRQVLNSLKTAVQKYNMSKEASSEKSQSILNPRSVHFIWHQLLEAIRSDKDFSSPECRRVVYEWCIPHPLTGTSLELDFTFIPAEISHLNWAQYSGGIELNINPPKSSPSGTANTLGRSQAFSRAAMCVYARCEKTKWVVPKSGCRAYCIFADARQFGVARVSVKSDLSITADVFGPVDLMGFHNASDPKAFLVLKHLLTSPMGDLQELISPPPQSASAVVEGRAESTGKVARWSRGDFLGAGGFAFVSAWGGGEQEALGVLDLKVIKTSTLSKFNDKLLHERAVLKKLRAQSTDESFLQGIPHCLDSLQSDTEVALCLSPRGVPVPKYFRFSGYNAEKLTQLVRLLGPAIVLVLRVAHASGIAHRDIRPANMIIVPPPQVAARIAKCRGDVLLESAQIKSIDLTRCRFVLNDWGEAKNGKTTSSELETSDLADLLSALSSPARLLAVSTVSTKRNSPVLVAEHGDALPSLNPQVLRELQGCASKRDYTKMGRLLSNVAFQIGWDQSQRGARAVRRR